LSAYLLFSSYPLSGGEIADACQVYSSSLRGCLQL